MIMPITIPYDKPPIYTESSLAFEKDLFIEDEANFLLLKAKCNQLMVKLQEFKNISDEYAKFLDERPNDLILKRGEEIIKLLYEKGKLPTRVSVLPEGGVILEFVEN